MAGNETPNQTRLVGGKGVAEVTTADEAVKIGYDVGPDGFLAAIPASGLALISIG
jgi:hypothetical protein